MRPVVGQNAAAATPQHCRRCAREQECARRLELAHQRHRLRRQSFGRRSLKANPNERIERSHLAIAAVGRRWRNGHSVASRTWCLDRHGFGQCLGAVEVEAHENPSWLARRRSLTPHKEAGYTSAVVTLGPEFAKPACNRAGSIYVQTWPLFAHLRHGAMSRVDVLRS